MSRETVECYKQNLTGDCDLSTKHKNADRNEDSKGQAHEVTVIHR